KSAAADCARGPSCTLISGLQANSLRTKASVDLRSRAPSGAAEARSVAGAGVESGAGFGVCAAHDIAARNSKHPLSTNALRSIGMIPPWKRPGKLGKSETG